MSFIRHSGGQGIWDDRNDISRVLDIGTDDVTVELISNGGAFTVKRICQSGTNGTGRWLLRKPVKTTES